MITSIWSSYGHRFQSTDVPEHESCMTCGAMYELIETPEEPWDGRYVNVRGQSPNECTGDTGMVHGYPGERYCQNDNGRPCTEYGEPCEHTNHDCDCLFCDS